MRRFFLTTLVISGGLVFASQPAPGIAVQILGTSQKVTQSDAVVAGKVSSIEKETVELPQYAGDKNKAQFTVAVIKVETALAGVKNVTHVKIAFLAQAVGGGEGAPVIKPGIRPIRPGGFGPVQLTEGQEGIFFLQKHPGSDNYYAIQQGMTPIAAKAENYKEELAKIKTITEAVSDPVKALKAEKLADRLTATAAIVGKYRTGVRGGQSVEVAIPAEETELIMKTLLEADWTVADMPKPGFDYQSSPSYIASMIGLNPGGNGIPQIVQKPGESYSALYKQAVKAWYEKSGEKFEIKKFVAKK